MTQVDEFAKIDVMKTPKAIVKCNAHGRWNDKNKTYEVVTHLPRHKREARGGCPMCNRNVPPLPR